MGHICFILFFFNHHLSFLFVLFLHLLLPHRPFPPSLPPPLPSKPPLCSDDDLSDDADAVFDCDDVIYCRCGQVSREKGGRWRIKLKEGIANIQGKDILFKECNSDLLDFL